MDVLRPLPYDVFINSRFNRLGTHIILLSHQEEEAQEEVVENLSNSDVTTKYQEAAKIANLALQGVIQQSVAGARVNDLCKFGDTVIEQVHTSVLGVMV